MGHSSTLHITNITSTTHFVENNSDYCHFSTALTALNTVDIISAAPPNIYSNIKITTIDEEPPTKPPAIF